MRPERAGRRGAAAGAWGRPGIDSSAHFVAGRAGARTRRRAIRTTAVSGGTTAVWVMAAWGATWPLSRAVGRVEAIETTVFWVPTGIALPLWRAIAPGRSLAGEWREWAVSGFVGALLAVPPIVAFAGCAAAIFQGDLSDRFGGAVGPTPAYLPLAPPIASAVLWGARGGPLAIATGALLVIGWTGAGRGPFAEVERVTGLVQRVADGG